MFDKGPFQPASTGKRMQGYQSRKQGQFNLGWDNTNQMNEIQIRKSKKQELTGKVNSQQFQPPRSGIQEPINSVKLQKYSYEEPSKTPTPNQLQKEEYERLCKEYPDIPPQEIMKIVMSPGQHPQQEQKPSEVCNASNRREYAPKQSYQAPLNYEAPKTIQAPQNLTNQVRQPVRPRQSMKNIIYGSQIGSQNENPQRAQSRRNNSNLILGDGFNHFKAQY